MSELFRTLWPALLFLALTRDGRKPRQHKGELFRWKYPRRERKVERPIPTTLEFAQAEEVLPEDLHGIPVDSKEEARIGVVLPWLGWDYRYQVPLFGGPELRGGALLDFLVTNYRPLPLPLIPNGVFWHSGHRAEPSRLQRIRIMSRMRGQWMPPLEVWDYELTSVQHAYNTLLLRMGRA